MLKDVVFYFSGQHRSLWKITRKHIQVYCTSLPLMSSTIRKSSFTYQRRKIPVYFGSFWTPRQRQAYNLHEIAYRACFKPALPRYFIEQYTVAGDVVYDPFSGRGTTVIEAAILGRNIVANDVNPLSRILAQGRLALPDLTQLTDRLDRIAEVKPIAERHNLSMFYHKKTLFELLQLRQWLQNRKATGEEDALDHWIRMVATNRLAGHSPGFFSVYTLPPNQAVSRERQKLINAQRNQKPEYRDVKALILKKSKSMLKDLDQPVKNNIESVRKKALFIEGDAAKTKKIKSNSVALTVTSPPFLDIVQYAKDNWLRCWFNDIPVDEIAKGITMSKTVEDWMEKMQTVFHELFRVTKPGGHLAFETGEIHYGKTRLEHYVVQMGIQAGFHCDKILINEQTFTKTANIWGVRNNTHGTNSHRIVVFSKPL